MNELIFSALEIQVQSNSSLFRDDSFVKHMGKHFDKVLKDIKKRKVITIENFSRPDRNTNGKYMIGYFSTHVEHIIFYEDLRDDFKNLVIRAHEETHVLHQLGLIEVLERELRKEGLMINLRKHKDPYSSDPEYVANIGGLYALSKTNKTVVNPPEHMEKALIDFNKAKDNFLRPFYKIINKKLYSLIPQNKVEPAKQTFII